MKETNIQEKLLQDNSVLTFPLLLDTLLNVAFSQAESDELNKDSQREFIYMTKLLQGMASLLSSFHNADDKLIFDKIRSEIDKNDILFAYTYYLSINDEFDYHWSYLRKKMDGYCKFILRFYKYMVKVVEYLNIMLPKLQSHRDLVIDFHGFLKVSIIDENSLDYMMEWSQLKNIIKVEKAFYVTVSKKANILLCWCDNLKEKNLMGFNSFLDNIHILSSSQEKNEDGKGDEQ